MGLWETVGLFAPTADDWHFFYEIQSGAFVLLLSCSAFLSLLVLPCLIISRLTGLISVEGIVIEQLISRRLGSSGTGSNCIYKSYFLNFACIA